MRLPVAIRRQGYRIAHRLLRVWWFVVRPRVQGVKCVLTDGDRVLLVRHTYGHSAWDLPGGGAKRDEEPSAAARREMEEELGIRIENMRSLGQVKLRAYRAHDRIDCFHAEIGAPELTIDEAELETVRWFPRDRLPTELSRYVPAVLARL